MQLFESETKGESESSADLRKIELEEIELEKKKITFTSKHFVTSALKDYYEMDSQVKYWSDFMKQKYHDRSYVLTNKYLNTNEYDMVFSFTNFVV